MTKTDKQGQHRDNKNKKIINHLFILSRDKEKVANARCVAALCYRGNIISYGFNQYRTSWVQRRFKKNPEACFLHAEVDAIKNAMKIVDYQTIRKLTLYVVRARLINNQYQFGNAKPCCGCQACIDWFGISKVYYTCNDGSYQQLNYKEELYKWKRLL